MHKNLQNQNQPKSALICVNLQEKAYGDENSVDDELAERRGSHDVLQFFKCGNRK